jgi:hypothetical protein
MHEYRHGSGRVVPCVCRQSFAARHSRLAPHNERREPSRTPSFLHYTWYPSACAYGTGQTCTPLVPDVMLNLVAVVYQPPTKIPLLSDDETPVPGAPVVNQ